MTVAEFFQVMVLVICLMATGVVLPIGVVAGSASSTDAVLTAAPGPVFVFEQAR